jgi:hypothetical protein
MGRILIGVGIVLWSCGVSEAQPYDQGTILGSRWYCISKFKSAGIQPYDSDPMFQSCVQKRAAEWTKERDGMAADADRQLQGRKQQLRREYGN